MARWIRATGACPAGASDVARPTRRGVAVGHDRELDAGIDGLVDRVGRDRIEDDDPALDLGGAQGQRLVERRDAQGVDDGLQRTGDRDEAVSIGIGLDDRRDTHARADDATDDR